MTLARITNFNFRNRFPTCVGNMLLRRGLPVEGDFDPRVLEELRKIPQIRVEFLKPRPDFSSMTARELKVLARSKGIARASAMRKAELIKTLEGQNGK